MMVERTGVQTEWAEATRKDLERTRSLLLDQPPGLGGLPPLRPTPLRQLRTRVPEAAPAPPRIPQACVLPQLLDTSEPLAYLRRPRGCCGARGCVFLAPSAQFIHEEVCGRDLPQPSPLA